MTRDLSNASALDQPTLDRHFPGRVAYQVPARVAAERAARNQSEDPRALHTLAMRYGREIARGDLEYDEAHQRLALIALAHWQVGPERFDEVMNRVDATLVRFSDADALTASREIRAGLQPLLDARAPTSALTRRAYDLSAARLLRPVCDAIVRDEIAKRLAPAARLSAGGAHGRAR